MTRAKRKKQFRAIALTGNPRDSRVMACMRALVPHLLAAGRTVYVSRDLGRGALPAAARRIADASFSRSADLVVAIGGDGTMLYAARHIAGFRVPVLGINQGRLGFLADLGPEHMLARVDEILAGRYVSEKRMLLTADLLCGKEVVSSSVALNDVVVKREDTGRMLEYQTFVGNRYVTTHLGDGLIVATPTGSTAYALSCGGPIVEPGLEALVLAPICPHTLSDRPIVIPANRVAEVRLRAGQSDRAEVTCDGETVGQLGPGWSIRVRAARERLELVHPVSYDYFDILRSKLHWGRDTRERGPDGTPGSGSPC